MTYISYTMQHELYNVTRLAIVIPYYTTSLNAQIIKVYVRLSSPFNSCQLLCTPKCMVFNKSSIIEQSGVTQNNELLHVFQFQMISAMCRREDEWMSNIC